MGMTVVRDGTKPGFGHGSNLIDKYIVDGAVNGLAYTAKSGSAILRRAQTGLVQNYALLMLFGVFAFVSIYLFMR